MTNYLVDPLGLLNLDDIPPETDDNGKLVTTPGAISHVVAETGNTGNFVAYYVRGDELLAVIRPTETRYYHADGLFW